MSRPCGGASRFGTWPGPRVRALRLNQNPASGVGGCVTLSEYGSRIPGGKFFEWRQMSRRHFGTSGLEAYVTLKEHGSRIPGTQWFERRLMSRRQKAGRRN